VVFPIGLWTFSLICNLIGLSVATSAVWFTAALYAMSIGLILSVTGVCMVAVLGWLGGQMVHVCGVGVEVGG
jgi:uncharacterized membrane protein